MSCLTGGSCSRPGRRTSEICRRGRERAVLWLDELHRYLDADPPLRMDYALTDLGRTLLEPVAALEVWAKAHRDHILTARESCGSRTV